MPGREPLPEGSTVADVIAAVQAAWLAWNFPFVRDLIDRYLDSPPHHFCFCCVQEHKATALYQFRPMLLDQDGRLSDGPIVRLCDDCWHATDKPQRDRWGPGVTVGALLRDSFYEDVDLRPWVVPEASGDP